MKKLRELLAAVEQICLQRDLTKSALAKSLGIPRTTFAGWFGDNARIPSKEYVKLLQAFVTASTPETPVADAVAGKRAIKIKYLLLLLEDELDWFRARTVRERAVLRRELDFHDVGYVSSLLTMLAEESGFQRHLALTTAKFKYFKKRGG